MPAHRFARLAEKGNVPVRVIPTPIEESLSGTVEFPCWPPEQRAKEHIWAYLRQTKGYRSK